RTGLPSFRNSPLPCKPSESVIPTAQRYHLRSTDPTRTHTPMHRSTTSFAAATAGRRFGFLTLLVIAPLAPWAGCSPPPSEERVVAFVNGKPITQTEFDHEWGDLPEATKARYEKEGGRQAFLKELVDHDLLLQESRRQGLDQSDVLRDRVRRYKEKLLIDELLKDRMKTTVELTKDELDRDYEEHARQLLPALKVRRSQ